MARKGKSTEEIIAALREAEVRISQGETVGKICRGFGISEQTYDVRNWLGRIGVKTLFIEPGSPWENGYCESFNSKLRDEIIAAEQFSTLYEAQVLIERWRQHYNAVRPHSSLGYRPPAPETILPPASGPAYAPLRPAQKLTISGRTLT